jgi:hypothetical protein
MTNEELQAAINALIGKSEIANYYSNISLNVAVVQQLRALFEIQLERAKNPCPLTPSTEK